METKYKPIGIFDSGIGGLSVLDAIQQTLPNEKVVYLNDSTHFPYGSKPKEQVIQYSLENTLALTRLGVKVVVIACHTAGALAATEVRKEFALPIVDMITPTLAWANKSTEELEVLATENTTHSGIYPKRIKCLPCPTFAPLVENQNLQSKETKETICSQVSKLKGTGIVILGCTHYSHMKTQIAQCLPKARILDPRWLVAAELKRVLKEEKLCV